MQPLIVDDQIWELFPEAQFQVLVAHGIDNHLAAMQTEHYQAMLDNAVKEAQKFITDDVFRNNPVISEWRDAFTKFKKKKGARSSIEALLKRVSQGKSLSPINPLVDIYNSISLEFGVPCGSEDLQKMDGTMHLITIVCWNTSRKLYGSRYEFSYVYKCNIQKLSANKYNQ